MSNRDRSRMTKQQEVIQMVIDVGHSCNALRSLAPRTTNRNASSTEPSTFRKHLSKRRTQPMLQRFGCAARAEALHDTELVHVIPLSPVPSPSTTRARVPATVPPLSRVQMPQGTPGGPVQRLTPTARRVKNTTTLLRRNSKDQKSAGALQSSAPRFAALSFCIFPFCHECRRCRAAFALSLLVLA